jgi:hypothetical protein
MLTPGLPGCLAPCPGNPKHSPGHHFTKQGLSLAQAVEGTCCSPLSTGTST